MRVGPLTLTSPYWLAPLEAVSDVGFRTLCRSLGAGLAFTEMLRAASFARENPSTLALADTYDEDVGVQFLVKSPEEMTRTLETFFRLRQAPGYERLLNVRAIDLNFGCPSPEIISIGAGPALLKRTTRFGAILAALRAGVERHDPGIAVGAKLRLGLNAAEKRAGVTHRLAPAINRHLHYVIVHGKHAGQRGSDPADWAALAALRARITIPFLANGGALDAARARALRAATDADGVVIARGAITDPWIFRQLDGGPPATTGEVAAARQSYEAYADRYGTKRKYREFHAANFDRLATEARNRNS